MEPPQPRVKLVLLDEARGTERAIEGFETWEAACARAARYVAHPRARGRWQHVLHTVWYDADAQRRLCVRDANAPPHKF